MPLDGRIPMSINNPGVNWAEDYQKGFDLGRRQVNAPLQTESLQIENKQKELANMSKKIEAVGSILSNVKDQASYDQARQIAISQGLATPQDVPEIYDPNTVDAWRSGAQSSLEVLNRTRLEFERKGGVQGALIDRANTDPQFRKGLMDTKLMTKGLRGGEGGSADSIPGYNTGVANTAEAEAEAKESGKQKGEITGKKEKREFTAMESIPMLERADNLLNSASGGGISSLYQKGKGVVGVSDDTTQANRNLKQLSGYLTANVPRMEGPQSDYDVKNYQEMAGALGNEAIPVEDRRAVLKQMLAMQAHYSNDPRLMQKYPGYKPFDAQEEKARLASEPLENQDPLIQQQVKGPPPSKSEALQIMRARGFKL